MEKQKIVLFDGVCNFCNRTVNFIIDRDPEIRFKFAALQSKKGQEILKKHHLPLTDFDSFVLIDNEKIYLKSDAFLKIITQLEPTSFRFFKIFNFIPVFIRDFVYSIIAKYRYKLLGKKEQCRIPTPKYKAHFLED